MEPDGTSGPSSKVANIIRDARRRHALLVFLDVHPMFEIRRRGKSMTSRDYRLLTQAVIPKVMAIENLAGDPALEILLVFRNIWKGAQSTTGREARAKARLSSRIKQVLRRLLMAQQVPALDKEEVEIARKWLSSGSRPVRVVAISARSRRGRLWFRCHRGLRVTPPVVQSFLCDLLRHAALPRVEVMHEMHPAYVAASTRRFVARQDGRLRLHLLGRGDEDSLAVVGSGR